MRVSTALLLKHLLTRLHPPAPATAGESARLLAVLDRAFRKQLDAAHPPPPSPTSSSLSSPPQQPEQQPQQHQPEPCRPANRHLESLLLHPLLQTKPVAPSHGPSPRTAVDDFDRALRTGTLTIAKLRRIAKHYLHQIKHKPSSSPEKLGHKLAAWLEAESAATKSSLFQSADVVGEVVPLMYADGLESTVWAWLRSLYQCDWVGGHHNINPSLGPRQNTAFHHAQDILVSEMMRMAIRQGSLHDAAAQYVAAAVYRRSQSTPTDTPLTSSYKRLSTAILHKRHRHGIEPATFDQILHHAIPFTRDRVISSGFLQLYHPLSPSAEALSRELNGQDSSSSVAAWSRWHSKHKLLHAALLVSVLDAAQLSLHQSKTRQAHFFLDLAEKHWPDYLSTSFACTSSACTSSASTSSASVAVQNKPPATTTSITSRLRRARQLLASHTNLSSTLTPAPHLQLGPS